MFFKLNLRSPNRNSVASVIRLFKEIYFTKKTNKLRSNPARLKFITVLKSPHVNKTAQDQFQKQSISLAIGFKTSNPASILVLLKKLRKHSFSDVSFQLSFVCKKIPKSNLVDRQCRILNPDCLSSNTNTGQSYLSLFDIFGESIKGKKTVF